MNTAGEHGRRGLVPPAPETPAAQDSGVAIAALRARGAQRADPVRFRYLEALARRAALHGGAARRLLDQRLAQALADCGARHDAARAAADADLAGLLLQFPRAADTLQRHHAEGDFRALRALAARLEAQAQAGPLAGLLRQLDPPAGAQAAAQAPAGAPAELRTLTQFRRTWTQLGIGRQLSRSLAKVPENPGPLNSQLLALRALQLMQDTSPAYLEAFMSQVEALLWLEDAAFHAAPAQARAPGREGDRKRKPGRGKTE
ncbi:MAG: DUF2894 domain-containing protein [Rubrivivax sp.]|nr:DUF2894 domain-containing protein [Rubrivivax sp.]